MNDLATVRLQQARIHMQAGNAVKAIEILEQARALSRGSRAVLVAILGDLVQAYNAAGQRRKADECAAELLVLMPGTAKAPIHQPLVVERSGSRAVPILVGSLFVLLLGAAGVIVWMTASMRYDEKPVAPIAEAAATQPGVDPAAALPLGGQPDVVSVVGVAATSLPAASPVGVIPEPVSQAIAFPVPVTAPVPASSVTATSLEKERAALTKDSVGLVVQVARYQGPVDGRICQMELPISTGTCFTFSRSGLMLTNRHVASIPPKGVPATLEELNLPTMVLRGTATIVCFGSEPAGHQEAIVLHVSNRFDMAILKINKPSAKPISIGAGGLTLGEQIYVCGYPGAVGTILAQANATDVVGRFIQQAATGTVSYTSWFDKGVFEPTLTAGIVSAAERNLDKVKYLQVDAKIAPGNSGGPVLNRNNEVVGIVTLGGTTTESQGYNFALSFPQMMDEIRPYLQMQ